MSYWHMSLIRLNFLLSHRYGLRSFRKARCLPIIARKEGNGDAQAQKMAYGMRPPPRQ